MGIQLITTPYGRAAAEALRAQVAGVKGADPLAPVTVVVPTNYVGVAMRRYLAAESGIAAVSLLTLYRLAELLGAPRLAAARRRPVSTPVLAAAVRAALAERPGVFAPVAEHAATEEALVAAHRELADVSAAGLERLAAQSRRAADVVAVHRNVRDRLAGGWFDEHDLMVAAVEALDAGTPLAGNLGTVVVHLPQDVSQAGGRLLRRLVADVPVVVVAGLTGDERADAGVRRSLERIGTPPVEQPEPIEPACGTEVVTVSDADEEVRAVVRRVVAGLRDGIPLERMAIVWGTAEPYAQIVHEQLTAAGIPHNGAAVRRLGDCLLGRTVRGLLALPDHRFRRHEVLALLAHAPIRGSGRRAVPSSAWERISRAAGVVAGADEWHGRLTHHATESRAEAEQAAEAGEEWLAERLRRDAVMADELREFVAGLVADLHPDLVATSWEGKVEWVHTLIRQYLGGERARLRWPAGEVRAAEKVEAALDRLRGLDEVEPSPSLEVFRRTLDLELDAGLDRVGRLGEGLLVGHVGMALGIDLDHVFVVGLAEGTFPPRRLDDSLLPDRERAALDGELAPRAEQADVDHRRLLAALAAAGDDRVLCFPRGDLRRAGDRVASRWLLDTVAALGGERVPSDALASALREELWFTEVPSFAGGLASVSFPANPQEYALRALLAHDRAGGRLTAHPLVSTDPRLARAVELTEARRSARFTRFDGNLGGLGLDLPDPADADVVVSATRLEKWSTCPHAFLLQRLGVEKVEAPDRLLDLSALDYGSIVHVALDTFLREVLERAEGAPAPDEPWSEADHRRLIEIAGEVCAGYEARGLTGKPVFWRRTRTRILRELSTLLVRDDERRCQRRCSPVASELAFGLPDRGPDPAVVLPLSDGRTVRFRGSADRVDATAGGELVVIDYKTGGPSSYQGLSGDAPDQGGTRLQLPIYALAARAAHGDATTPVLAAYWFVTTKGGFKWIGYDVHATVLVRIDEVVRTIVDGIAGGVFVAHPAAPTSYRSGWVPCDYCDPDGLGTGDRRREWERKRRDPALAGYVALVEPEEATLV